MNPDRNLVRYACVAHSTNTTTTTTPDVVTSSTTTTTILAEYNPSGDVSIHELAQKCLIRTPAYHSIFNHNIRGTSYTLVIEDPFVFFAVSDEVMPKRDRIDLLNLVKEALGEVMNRMRRNLKKKGCEEVGFSEYCFQGELGSVFGRLLGVGNLNGGGESGEVKVNDDDVGSYESSRGIGVGCGRRGFGVPVSSKKKRKCFEESESKEVLVLDGGSENIVNNACLEEVSGEVGVGGGLCSSDGKLKAKKMWRKHVWIVLFMDLALCLILFGIWLMICHGFQCLDG